MHHIRHHRSLGWVLGFASALALGAVPATAATGIVMNAYDSGAGSLWQIIADSAPG